jgi:hypothetical protein
MSQDHQFTATGPAAVGFQTDGTAIDRGVHAQGTIFGVDGYGGDPASPGDTPETWGVRGTGESGVIGVGTDVAGGKFSSADLVPQLHLKPQPVAETWPGTTPVPWEYPKPQMLSKSGNAGDLFLAQHDAIEGPNSIKTCSLWLCVEDCRMNAAHEITRAARWRQVLLGGIHDGTASRIHP